MSDLPADNLGDNMRMSNFMKDLQAARADNGAQGNPNMMNLGMRGFTKVKELLEGFENDSDFVISQREADQSVMGSARNRTGTMMTNQTLNATQRIEFENLIQQSRAFIDELKFMENEREIAEGKGEDDVAQPVASPYQSQKSMVKSENDGGGIQFINEGVRVVDPDRLDIPNAQNDQLELNTIQEESQSQLNMGLTEGVLLETISMLDESDERDFLTFQKRKDTIMTNMDNISKLKFPDNEKIQKQLMKTVTVALNQEQVNFIKQRKTVRRRQTLKAKGASDKQITEVLQKQDLDYKLYQDTDN